MECEGVKPVLAQHCMKFHFPVKGESAEEWADLGPDPARAEWQPESRENGAPLCVREDQPFAGQGEVRRRLCKLFCTSEAQAGRNT